jgi:hypothetical protein
LAGEEALNTFEPFQLFKQGSAIGLLAAVPAIELVLRTYDAKAQTGSTACAEVNLCHDSTVLTNKAAIRASYSQVVP